MYTFLGIHLLELTSRTLGGYMPKKKQDKKKVRKSTWEEILEAWNKSRDNVPTEEELEELERQFGGLPQDILHRPFDV